MRLFAQPHASSFWCMWGEPEIDAHGAITDGGTIRPLNGNIVREFVLVFLGDKLFVICRGEQRI